MDASIARNAPRSARLNYCVRQVRAALAYDARSPRFIATIPRHRIGIIDFSVGALPHRSEDHGIAPSRMGEDFVAAGFEVATRNGQSGGRNYLIVFRPR